MSDNKQTKVTVNSGIGCLSDVIAIILIICLCDVCGCGLCKGFCHKIYDAFTKAPQHEVQSSELK